MARHRFIDYRIRGKGSPEVAWDPVLILDLYAASKKDIDKKRAMRCAKVYAFIVITAMKILPPVQKTLFYSVWVRSGGSLRKGIMDYSRKTGKNSFSSYNSFYKSVASVKRYLEESGYAEHLCSYLLEKDGDEVSS